MREKLTKKKRRLVDFERKHKSGDRISVAKATKLGKEQRENSDDEISEV